MATSEGPIDLAHLARYTMGNRALELEILDLFIQQAPATIARLQGSGDQKAWREAAHTLKGSARAVGAWRLADAAARAEQVQGWADAGLKEAALSEIRAACDDVALRIRSLHEAVAA